MTASSPSFMLFSPLLLDALRACKYSPTATCGYDLMAGGLIWDDEIPPRTDYGSNLRASVHLRKVIAYRASLILDEPRTDLEEDWVELMRLLPAWPGFRPERVAGEAKRLLKVHKYKESKAIRRLERDGF